MLNKKSIYKITTVLLVSLGLIYIIWSKNNNQHTFDMPLFIAHAGGGINELTYLNSLETLNHNYQLGHRFFEMDFSWTSDEELVLIHDWVKSYKRLFNNDSKIAPTESEFLSLEMNFDQTQLSLKQFAQWMVKHPDAVLVADIKKDNIKGLKKMLTVIKNPFKRIIPQVYHPKNYQKIQDLGFKNILFAMYNTFKPTEELLEFIQNNDLIAVSIKPIRKDFNEIIKVIGNSAIPVYTLTVNDPEQFKRLQALGVDGTVTDFLYPQL